MNFTINQTNGIRETVNSEFINKLYNLFITNRSSHTISLSGYLYSPTGYKAQMDALNQQYGPDLVIEVPEAGQYILIEDPAVLQILINNNISSDGIGISALDASTANLTASMFKNNTNITSFNQFRYFTRANNNPVNELFRGCTNLESVDLSSVIRISTQEFQSSGIKNISAHSLQSLGENAFSYSKVENILDLGQVIEIPQGCFSDCPNLISAVIPETVTSLGGGAFNAYNTSYNKVFTTITGLNNVQNFGERCFAEQSNLNLNASDIRSAVIIRSQAFSNVNLFSGDLNLKSLQVLEGNTFRNTKISKILSLGKITSIPAYAFVSDNVNSSLTEAYIPYECLSIDIYAFYNRTGLTTIKQYTQSVDDWVEGETPTYTDISRVTTFGQSCFQNCSQLQLSASALTNATTIGAQAFQNCSLLTGTLNLPNLTSLGSEAFTNTNITEINSLGTISSIGNTTFDGCSNLQGVVDLSSTHITSIGTRVFRNTKITGVIFPKQYLRTFGALMTNNAIGSTVPLTILKGLDGVTTVNNVEGNCNITNAIYMGAYVSGGVFPIICGQLSSSINQIYLPSFTHDTQSHYAQWYAHINGSFFTYRCTNSGIVVSMNLIYFKDLQSIQDGMFHRTTIRNLVINNNTPPSFDTSSATYDSDINPIFRNNIFGTYNSTGTNGMIIYVPDSAVTTYQADSNYNSYVIRGINEINPSTNQPYLTRYATNDLWEAAGNPADALIEEYMS